MTVLLRMDMSMVAWSHNNVNNLGRTVAQTLTVVTKDLWL